MFQTTNQLYNLTWMILEISASNSSQNQGTENELRQEKVDPSKDLRDREQLAVLCSIYRHLYEYLETISQNQGISRITLDIRTCFS